MADNTDVTKMEDDGDDLGDFLLDDGFAVVDTVNMSEELQDDATKKASGDEPEQVAPAKATKVEEASQEKPAEDGTATSKDGTVTATSKDGTVTATSKDGTVDVPMEEVPCDNASANPTDIVSDVAAKEEPKPTETPAPETTVETKESPVPESSGDAPMKELVIKIERIDKKEVDAKPAEKEAEAKKSDDKEEVQTDVDKKTPQEEKPTENSNEEKTAVAAEKVVVKEEPKDKVSEFKAPAKVIKKESTDEKLDAPSENTLILTNDEDIENSLETEKVESEKDDSKTKPKEQNFVWVSNICKSIKASNLKRHFSRCGKVNTAKVVTNGKLFFGYVNFSSNQSATNAVEKLNNSLHYGRKIIVSRTRPDVNNKKDKTTNSSKTTKKPDSSNGKTDATEKPKIPEMKNDPLTLKCDDVGDKRVITLLRKDIDELKKDVDKIRIDNRNLRRRLHVEEDNLKVERQRSNRYQKEARDWSTKLKVERREHMDAMMKQTKKNRFEEEKLQHEKTALYKEKDELRRRAEDLDKEFKKLEEAKRTFERMRRTRKSRSPSPTGRAPPKRFRGKEERFPDGHRSPPPPPKLTSDSRDSRSSKHYYEEKKSSSRGVYDRLGDAPYSKPSSSRHERSGYPTDTKSSVSIPQKEPWGAPPMQMQQPDVWKRSNNGSSYPPKPFMDRFASTAYPVQPMTFYTAPTSYSAPPKRY